jgi:hypothetical protein
MSQYTTNLIGSALCATCLTQLVVLHVMSTAVGMIVTYEGVCKTIILLAFYVSVKFESLTSREEHRLRMYENWVLRRIFGLKRNEVTGGWRKLHNEELHNL